MLPWKERKNVVLSTEKERPFWAPHSTAMLIFGWAISTNVFGHMPLKHSAPSSANQTGAQGLFLFISFNKGSKARFHILLLRTPPWGVPHTGRIANMTPKTSAIDVLFLRSSCTTWSSGGIFVVNHYFVYSNGCQIVKITLNINWNNKTESFPKDRTFNHVDQSRQGSVSALCATVSMLHLGNFTKVVSMFP